MAFMEFAGCMLIAFGPPLAICVFVVISDSLRIILFVGGAFFWLLSLLITSSLWYVIKPLHSSVIVSLVLLMFFEEMFRFAYYYVIRKAESGIEKITSTAGHAVAVQVHSLTRSRNVVALVCGLGFGTMCGAFLLINVLADSYGPGTVGLPASMELSQNSGTYLLFLISALSIGALILLHAFWNVIFWHGCYVRSYATVFAVCCCHVAVGMLSMLHQQGWSVISLMLTYAVLVVCGIVCLHIAGSSWQNFRAYLNSKFGNRRSFDVRS